MSEVMSRSSILLDKKVEVKPILRGSTWLESGHDGEFKYTGTFSGYTIPLDRNTNQLKAILTREEQDFFEKELELEKGALSFYKKGNSFWSKFVIKLDKEGTTLNLVDPIDNLKWRVLLANKEIAADPQSRFNSPHYKFMIVDSDYQTEERAKKANLYKDAYKAMAKMENTPQKMKDVLRLYGKKTANNVATDFLIAEIDKLIETDVKGFLTIINNPDYDARLLLEDAIEAKAIVRRGKTGYDLPGGDKIGGTTEEAIAWLKNPKYSEEVLTIKARIENNK